MSQAIETAVRNHLQANDAVQETIEWSEIATRLERGSSPIVVPRRSDRRGIWVAAAAVVVTILLVGVIPLLFNNDDLPVADTNTPTTLVDSTPTTLAADVVATTVPSSLANPEVTDVIDVGGWPRSPLVAAGGAYWLARWDGETGALLRIDTITLEVTDIIPLGVHPNEMFPTDDGLWVLDIDSGELFLVDTSTLQIIDSIELLDRRRTAAFGEGGVIAPVLIGQTLWVHTQSPAPQQRVVEVDLESRTVVSETPILDNIPWWAEEIDGAIWSYDGMTDVLWRFDLQTHGIQANSYERLDNKTGACCIAADDAIWLVDHEGIVRRFDLATRQITDRLEFDGGVSGGVAAAGAIWISSEQKGDGVVLLIDLETRQVTDVIPVGSEPGEPVFADGAIWVPVSGDGTVSRIDVETRQVTHTIQTGNRPETPFELNGAIWVPNLENGTITRIQTR